MEQRTETAVFRYDFKFTKNSSREIVRAVMHTILFHRVFGSLQPKEVEVFGLSFPQVVDPEIEKLVNEQTERLVIALEHKSSVLLSIRFLENRFIDQKKDSKSWFKSTLNNTNEQTQMMRNKEESQDELVWEKWEIGFKIHSTTSAYTSSNHSSNKNNHDRFDHKAYFNPIGFLSSKPLDSSPDHVKSIKSIQLQLVEFLSRLIDYVFTHRDHIPPITNTDLSPFPVDISILPVSNIG